MEGLKEQPTPIPGNSNAATTTTTAATVAKKKKKKKSVANSTNNNNNNNNNNNTPSTGVKKKRIRKKKAAKKKSTTATTATTTTTPEVIVERLDVRSLHWIVYRDQLDIADQKQGVSIFNNPCCVCHKKTNQFIEGFRIPRRCHICLLQCCSNPKCGADTIVDKDLVLTCKENRVVVCSLCFPGWKRKLLFKGKLEPNFMEDALLAIALAEEDMRTEELVSRTFSSCFHLHFQT
jgi:hypothetical protein